MGIKAQLWFYKGPGKFFDKLIRFWTKSSYSHVEIVIDGIACGADAWTNKVRCVPVLTFNRENWDIVEVDLSQTVEWLRRQEGKKYDWLGILGYLTFSFEDPKRWYCSELAAAAIGYKRTLTQVSPGELYDRVTGETA